MRRKMQTHAISSKSTLATWSRKHLAKRARCLRNLPPPAARAISPTKRAWSSPIGQACSRAKSAIIKTCTSVDRLIYRTAYAWARFANRRFNEAVAVEYLYGSHCQIREWHHDRRFYRWVLSKIVRTWCFFVSVCRQKWLSLIHVSLAHRRIISNAPTEKLRFS